MELCVFVYKWRCENQILSHDYGVNGVELC